MTARYLIRLDDACPTMNHCRWRALEAMFDSLDVRPIVAVVPDNRDPELMCDEADKNFWDRVRRWEGKGWTIAMHGLHHLYHQVDRRRLVLPFHGRSEFAGLDLATQSALIRESWSSFAAQGLRPTVWVAPSHSFDQTTLRALAAETSIRIISDGLALSCYFKDGFQWVPQQLWHPAPRKHGVWTICLHPNSMSDGDVTKLRSVLAHPFYRMRLAGMEDVPVATRPEKFRDRLYARYFMARHHLLPILLPAYRGIRRIVGHSDE